MRQVLFERYGGPEVLQVVDVSEPHADAGQVRIAARASSLAPGEMAIRSGLFANGNGDAFPYRTGHDAAGVVDEVGAGVTGVRIGDEVFGMGVSAGCGANSDFVVLSTWAHKPTVWTWAEATVAAGASETSTRVLDQLIAGHGETIVINGASGVVGTVATQLAIARNCRVIGTAGENNQDYVRSLGATPVVYGEGLADRVKALGVSRIDAVFDCAGKDVASLVALTGDPARVVTIADPRAGEYGVHLSHGAGPAQSAALGVPGDPPARHGLALAAALAESRGLQVPVAATFPLSDVVSAARALQDRHLRGKIVLLN
ncbi:NADP-dependent oxidoreductase [Streptomyces misionensis]|uniref:NADP-dependent oxidoreductase n=1 Tax=Streptomyces misionensis TaxID=67331 RepID=UPI0033EDFBD0